MGFYTPRTICLLTMDPSISVHGTISSGGLRHRARARAQDGWGPRTPTRIVPTRRMHSAPTGMCRAPVYHRVHRDPIPNPSEMAREGHDLPDVNTFPLAEITRVHRDSPLVDQNEPEGPSLEKDLPVGEGDGASGDEIRCERDVPAYVALHPLKKSKKKIRAFSL